MVDEVSQSQLIDAGRILRKTARSGTQVLNCQFVIASQRGFPRGYARSGSRAQVSTAGLSVCGGGLMSGRPWKWPFCLSSAGSDRGEVLTCPRLLLS